MSALFPDKSVENRVICTPGVGSGKGFSAIITDVIPCHDLIEKSQCFPRFIYKPKNKNSLLDSGTEKYTREDGITDAFLDETRGKYGTSAVTKEDIFYYLYGIFHSPQYREQYADDLRVSLARAPLVKAYADFIRFSQIGRQLALLHLNYDRPEKLKGAVRQINKLRPAGGKLPDYPITVTPKDIPDRIAPKDFFRVEKTRFGKKGKDADKSRILYNERITLSGIPEKAHQYIVNGKSALEWVMERYAVTTDKQSGIVNDPNLWDEKNPGYIVDLLRSVITVSALTMDLVGELPALVF